jgi:hypothetical protein
MFCKQKPFRSKALMNFVHRHMKPAPCAVCEIRPWRSLHHFGFDGGQGMKPSDHMLVRLCRECAQRYEVKWKAMFRDQKWALFNTFAKDAFRIVRAYIEHLEMKGGANVLGGNGEDAW